MAINLPAAPKVYTTTYDNFKGVDYTNDSTNIWRRRSPTGTNMLPDASGRPFKRKGWDVLLSQEALCDALSVDACQIMKLSYFELAGKDHIVVFTNRGVIFYNGTSAETVTETDPDCLGGYDRCFFFEGGGTSAFYIYGNFRVWRYSVDEEGKYVFAEVTDKATVPRVLASTSAMGAGTFMQAYNLIGQYAMIDYNDVDLFNYWCSDGITITINESTFKTNAGSQGNFYIWVYNDSATPKWQNITTTGGGTLAFANSGITVSGEKEDGMAIVVTWLWGVMLPNNVSQDQINVMKAYGSTNVQFDTELEPVSQATSPSSGQFAICTDPTGKTAWVKFNQTDAGGWGANYDQGATDSVRVQFPVATITMTNYATSDNIVDESVATLDCEVVS